MTSRQTPRRHWTRWGACDMRVIIERITERVTIETDGKPSLLDAVQDEGVRWADGYPLREYTRGWGVDWARTPREWDDDHLGG